MPTTRWRERSADALGLLLIVLVLLDYFRPALLFLPTVAAGGDTPCHYPTAVWFREHLLPEGRLHGWYPGSYLGQPLLLYYFPLPFLIMAGLAPLLGMPAAFKLGTALGVFLLPFFAYLAFRLMGFRFPGPLLGAAAAAVFLFFEGNPIWGGTIASTLTGEFSYTYGIGLAVAFLGLVYRTYARGGSPLGPAALLGLTALAHGYAVLWAGLSATFFLYATRKPLRTLWWLLGVAVLAFAFAALTLVPLLADWSWTTPYADPWITVTTLGLVPPYLLLLFVPAVAGLAGTLLYARRTGGPDHRLLFLAHAALVGAALAAAGPALGIIDVRFVPFAQLALCLVGAASLGLVLEGAAAPALLALGLVAGGLLYGDLRSNVLRFWTSWNYTGLEAKELWPAFRQVADVVRGGVGDGRVAVEYSSIHEKAGSIRMYETLPFFSGRSTLEGVYNQASLQTHAVYYLASELGATSPNPFREIEYAHFDLEAALAHLRLFAVNYVVALSPLLDGALRARSDVELLARIAPYSVYRLRGDEPRYVEPLRFAPVRSRPLAWREKAQRWFTRRPLPPAHLVFSDDPRFAVVEEDEWLPPPAVPLEPGVELRERVEAEQITIETNRLGHPLLVKVSYHPRWRAEGAFGPYLVSPALMMVIPREHTVRLSYGRTGADHLGLVLTVSALLAGLGRVWRRRTAAPVPAPPTPAIVPDPCSAPPPPLRWGGLVPGALVLSLAVARFVPAARDTATEGLYAKASLAYNEGRFEDAAEYSRLAAARSEGLPVRQELLCLRGESLLRAGHPDEAAQAFELVVREFPQGPYVAQALFSGALAQELGGDTRGAAAARQKLADRYPDTPWAHRLDAHPEEPRPGPGGRPQE
jgi:hypothetical protein